MIDLNFNFKKFYFVTIIYIIFSYNNLILTKKFNIIDLNWRLFFNESFVYYYYFFWTNFWYIYLYILFLLIFIRYRKTKNINYLVLIVVYFLLIHYTDYYVLNSIMNKFSTFNKLINNLLSNKFNKIHPFLFYTTITLIIYINIFERKKSYIYYVFFIIVMSLILGSWWALQEGSWGGWWNWDASEMFGLIIFFYSLLILHLSLKKNFQYYYYFLLRLYLTLIFIFYILLQLNFSIASHNFGNFSSGNYLYKSYSLFILIILLKYTFYSTSLILYNLNFFINFFNLKPLIIKWSLKLFLYFKILLVLILIFLIYNSYLVILNNFSIFINLFLIKTNFKVYRNYLIYLFLLILLFVRTKPLYYLVFTFTLATYNNFFLPLSLSIKNFTVKKNYSLLIHYLILLLIYFNFNILWKSSLCFYDLTHYSYHIINNYFLFYNYNNLTLDNSYFFITNYFVYNNNYLNYTTIQNSFWRKIYITKLSLPWSDNIVWQGLYRLKYQLKYLLLFAENNIQILLIIVIIIMCLYYKLYTTKHLIIV